MVPETMLHLLQQFGRMDWLAFGVRDRIIRHFVNPDKVGPQEFETDFFGLKYQGSLNTFIDWSVYFYGAYEKGLLYLMRDLLQERQNPVFIDVGANVGQHSLFMSKFCHEVHAFEPYERVSTLLLAKIALNNLSNIVLHQVGLGDKNEFLDFYAPEGCNIGTGSFMPDHAADNNVHIGKLEIVAGDPYIAKLQLPRLDLIKIDVEGFEKCVLLGLKGTLARYRPWVVMEYSVSTRNNMSVRELREILPSDYRLQKITTNSKYGLFFNRSYYNLTDFDYRNPCTGDLLLLPG
ncbi:MAG: FkbM family methyltransferase [Deltaproteobacteria bacterium]